MPSYYRAIEFIALNDEPDENDPEVISGWLSVCAIGAAFGKPEAKIAADVVAFKAGAVTPRHKAEAKAERDGYDTAIHGGLRGFCPYRKGKVFGADLHRAWHRGYSMGQEMLDRNLTLEVEK